MGAESSLQEDYNKFLRRKQILDEEVETYEDRAGFFGY
jgi:hypothetical protein